MSNPSLYKRLVSSLVYLTVTRRDISYVVHQMCKFLCNIPVRKKEKKKVKVRFLLMVPMCPPPNPTTHHFPPLIFILSIFSLWPAHSLHFFSFFFSFSHTILSTLILSTNASTPPPPPPFSTIILRQDHQKIVVNP